MGRMAGKQVTVLNGDGCNTNILSIDLVRLNWQLLKIRNKATTILHFDNITSQKSDMSVLNAAINLGSHVYE